MIIKKTFLLLPFVLCSLAKAQTGINTRNPQGILHVDGARDNPDNGIPSAIQQSNDFILTSMGNVGVGTITPTVKLEINSRGINGAIKIVDGTQGLGKVLTSDTNGIGTWNASNATKSTVLGEFPATEQVIESDGTGVKGTNVKIPLTKGKWIVNAGLTINSQSERERTWLHCYLSSSQNAKAITGFELMGPAGAKSAYAGAIFPRSNAGNDGKFQFISGSQIINVTSDNIDIWLIIENRRSNIWNYNTGSYENFFYAIPIN